MSKILLIDDNPKNLQVAMNILNTKGYDLVYAQDGEKGIELATTNDIDLILLDVLMPGMNGYEACKKLKSLSQTKDIPIIFLTIKDEEKDIVKGFDYGGVDYVTKPFYASVLLKRVKTHLELSHSTKELQKLNKNLNKEVDIQIRKIRQKDQILSRQSKMASMGEMIANIAHQWRQPLGAISSAIISMKIKYELEKFDLESKDGRSECLEFTNKKLNDISEYIQILSTTIDDFRNFFKHQKDKENFDLNDIVNKSIKLLESNFQGNNIKIINKVQHYKMSGFGNELAQVIINILNNSRDALLSDDDNTDKFIKISSKAENGFVEVNICDSGGGIKDDIIDKIFEPYFTTKHSSSGTGIGLYMSEEIITKHMNGIISVENKDLGASFTIRIPQYL